MAWHCSRSHKFDNILGQPYACTPDTEAWKRVSQSHQERQTYEQIDSNAADIDKDHVVVYNTAGVSDAKVPLLAASAFDWNYIAAESPDFTPQMLNVADLLYKTEFELVNRPNAIMEPAGLTKVYHVSEAISRADNKFMSVAEKDALELTLDTFFTEIAGDHALACRQQWHICSNWMRTRIAVAHPLSCSNLSTGTQRLRQVHHSIQHEQEYELVREAAMAMTACLARMWNTAL